MLNDDDDAFDDDEEEEILTHRGLSLAQIEKFEAPESSEDEEEAGRLDGKASCVQCKCNKPGKKSTKMP